MATPSPIAPMPADESRSRRLGLAAGVAIGALVALTLGVVGSISHTSPTTFQPPFFSSVVTFKVWVATAVLVLAGVQLLSALWLYGRIPFIDRIPRRLGTVHRVSGASAFILCIPVAYYCLFDFGFQHDWAHPRVALHSLAGCLFFGAFIIKVTLVRSSGLRGWLLPVAGGALITLIVVLWSTSALWFFQTSGLHR